MTVFSSSIPTLANGKKNYKEIKAKGAFWVKFN
jgi:hypothetical protein